MWVSEPASRAAPVIAHFQRHLPRNVHTLPSCALGAALLTSHPDGGQGVVPGKPPVGGRGWTAGSRNSARMPQQQVDLIGTFVRKLVHAADAYTSLQQRRCRR